ncbi:MAG: hypothetical protein O9282_02580 [Flavobacterium sp.]|jgi:hypothetical protein|uniref:hypothetical protein n=1 Tax=Flavobacterium sp. TaxID=239 RepID=UPI0022C366BA|nr:hypothetical protein [Flavobacterium sp.]MCZ8330180.1 hypothetical protein [Flavobacterium sp.]
MKSNFTYKSYLFPIVVVVLAITSVNIISENYPINVFKLRWIDYYMIILFITAFVWLIKYEIARKMIVIEINENFIIKKNFLFNVQKYNFNDMVETETKVDTMRFGNFEETIITFNDGSKVILSEFFITNYKELKVGITKIIKNLHQSV